MNNPHKTKLYKWEFLKKINIKTHKISKIVNGEAYINIVEK